ncbi:MAG: endo-1,4-beta-xylanase [Geminicoccaceae bacterium]
MRVGFWAVAAMVVAACDQVTIAEPEATWAGSIGRLAVDGTDPGTIEFVYLDGAGPKHGKMTEISVQDAGIERAVRLETLGQPARVESLQARLASTGDIHAGAACWLRFEARAVQPQVELGLGRLSIKVLRNEPDQSPLLDRSIYLEPVWTSFDLKFAAQSDIDSGEVEVAFGVGTQVQVVDIGGVSMRCFDDDRALRRLPATSFSYAGREPEAPWRATAESQIERYRKGDLTIEVTDADGQPVSDVEIHIQMSQHAFEFGAAIDAEALAGTSEEEGGNTASYRKNLKEMFNTVTFDRPLHWTAWSDEANRQAIEDALAWVRSLGLDLRGRGLVSTEVRDLPFELQEKRDDPDAIREAIHAGITAIAGELDGSISAWDVVDRPREHHDLLDLLGWDEMATWFRLARSAAPNVGLALNESDILAGDRMAELATLLGNLLGEDVPIDRIGVQGRFGAQPPPIQVLSDRLDQLASFNLPLIITAFDMVTTDEQLQHDFVRDFLTLAFSHPSVDGFVFGRFWEEEGAPARVAMYRLNGTITPIGKVYRELVLSNWWTDIVALSNADGVLASRVFQGDYRISARKDGLSASATLSLGPDGTDISLTLAANEESDRAL